MGKPELYLHERNPTLAEELSYEKSSHVVTAVAETFRLHEIEGNESLNTYPL